MLLPKDFFYFVRRPLAMNGTERHGADENEVGYPFDFDVSNIRADFPLMFCSDVHPAQEAAFVADSGRDQWPMKTCNFCAWPIQPPRNASRFIRVDAGNQVMNARPQALEEMLLLSATE